MRPFLLATASILATLPASAQDAPAYAPPDALTDPAVLAVHDRLLTLDTHIDIGTESGTLDLDPGVITRAQVDVPSMRIGGLDGGFFIVYVSQGDLDEAGYAEAQAAAEDKYRAIVRMVRGNRDDIEFARSADEVEEIVGRGKLYALVGIENSYPLGTTPEEVRERVAMWADRGARYASITHFGNNQFGGSSNPNLQRDEPRDPGLSDLGRVLVGTLNDHGIMVDISHVGARTAADAMEASRAPVIASHSTAAAIYEHPRGLTDDQLRAIRDGGGVAQITAFRPYLADVDPATSEAVAGVRERLGLASGADFRAASPATLLEYAREVRRAREENPDVTLATFIDHVVHAVEVAGVDHVGLSGDFDGGGGVEGWDGAADSANVTAALLERGYSEEDLAKIWGGNLLRVMREVAAAAKE